MTSHWILVVVWIVFWLAIVALVANVLGDAAHRKGHKVGGKIFALALFATPIVAGLYVIALPDRGIKLKANSLVDRVQRQSSPHEAAQIQENFSPQAEYQPAQQSYGYSQDPRVLEGYMLAQQHTWQQPPHPPIQ